MTRTEGSPRASAAGDGRASALDRAAEALESLTRTYEDGISALEAAEATVDAILDDPASRVLVLDAHGRVVALGRGMSMLLGEDVAVLGRQVEGVVPASWPVLDVVRTLTVSEGWRSVLLGEGEGRLCLRRVTDDDRRAVVVVRFEDERPPG
jgi:hypothetical protein